MAVTVTGCVPVSHCQPPAVAVLGPEVWGGCRWVGLELVWCFSQEGKVHSLCERRKGRCL